MYLEKILTHQKLSLKRPKGMKLEHPKIVLPEPSKMDIPDEVWKAACQRLMNTMRALCSSMPISQRLRADDVRGELPAVIARRRVLA
jgi:hypothetical protein